MDGRFVFRLETLLKVRKETEKRHSLRVAECEQACEERRQAMDWIQDETKRVARSTRQSRSGHRLDVNAFRVEGNYRRGLMEQRLRYQQELADHSRRLIQAQSELVEAARAVKALQKLKERQRNRIQEGETRKLNAEEEEISLNVFRRRVWSRSSTLGSGTD